MLNPELTEVMEIADNLQRLRKETSSNVPILLQAWRTKLETALIFDAVELFYDTLYNLTVGKKKVIAAVPVECAGDSTWNEGYSIINLMKSVGIIHFKILFWFLATK